MANLIGTAGHVDHGKTTLIRALTGIDADRLPEEKQRGLTIDIGFAYIDLPDVGRVSIVDVPGHERFLTNMLVGAMGIDVALLCVAADESVMPQTVEHFQIIELLPVERMVVAVTRADLVDADTIALVQEEIVELLAPTRFKSSPIVPVSAMSGAGLDELKLELSRSIGSETSPLGTGWFMPIDRVFTVKGRGVVVTGTLSQGEVHEGDQAVLQPTGLETRVRSVQSHGESQETSKRGRRTALNLVGVKLEEVERGQMVSSPGVAHATLVLDSQVRWLKPPRHGSRVRVSLGADEAIARAFLNDADPSLLQLRFERPVAAAKGQPLIVRMYSPPQLLGGGRVIVPQATQRRKSSEAKFAATGGSIEEEVVKVVGSADQGLSNEELCRLLGKSPQALGDVLERLKSGGQLFGFAGLWMTSDQFTVLTGQFLRALDTLHQSSPTTLFHLREEVVDAADLSWKGKPLDRIVSQLASEGKIRVQGTSVALASFKVKFSDKQRAMLDRVTHALTSASPSVPNPEEIAKDLNVPKHAVEEIIRVGIAAGEIVRIEEGIFIPSEALTSLIERVRKEFVDAKFTASEFRERFKTSRKYAIPILEYLDSKGVTKRMGDVRVLA